MTTIYKKQVLIVFFILAICCGKIYGQVLQSHRIQEISQKEGLTSNKISTILKDASGFIWIGTVNGLNLYDGNQVNHKISINNGSTFFKPYIRDLYEDSKKRLWVCTDKGLFLKDENGIDFLPILFEKQNTDDRFIGIHESENGSIYVATDKNVFVIDQEKMILKSSWITEKLEKQKASLSELFIDSKDRLWLGTWGNGMYLFDLSEKTVSLFNESLPKDSGANLDNILTIIEGPLGNIWAGAYDFGLWKFDGASLKGQFMTHENSNPYSINSNKIKSLVFDDKGYLWIGLEESGLDRYSPQINKFDHFYADIQNERAYEGYSVYSICIDDQNTMWLGFRNDGVKKIPLTPSIFSKTSLGEESNDQPLVLSATKKNNVIWAGVKGGIESYHPITKKRAFYATPKNRSVISIASLDESTLIIGTFNGELFEFNNKTKKFTWLAQLQPTDSKGKRIDAIHIIDRDNILFGGQPGTFRINRKTKKLTTIASVHSNQYIQRNQSIFIIGYGKSVTEYYPDTGKIETYQVNEEVGVIRCATFYRNRLFIGSDYGLFAYDFEKQQATKLISEDYTFNEINSLFSDTEGNLWYSSVKDIFRYNIEDNYIRNYDVVDGLPNIRFKDGVFTKVSDSKVLFGGEGGAVLVDLNTPKTSRKKPKLAFTSISIAGDTTIVKNLYGTSLKEPIVFKSSENNITINYSLLSYSNKDRQIYQYKLENKWIDFGNKSHIDLIDLKSGDYDLELRAIDEFGYTTNVIHLPFYIEYPIWLRWYTVMIYIAIGLSVVIIIMSYRSRKMELEKDIAIQNIKTESIREKSLQEVEFHNLRLKFFTNISHEIRTPLTLIIAPLEKFVQKGKVPSAEYLGLMYKNAQRLKRLTTQILDFRKMESNRLRFEPTYGDLVVFTKECVKLFDTIAEEKNLNLKINTNLDSKLLWFDRDKYEKILINLLSNAFKYTSKGFIEVELFIDETDDNKTNVSIKVIDTGIGISDKDLPNIFDRFFHLNAENFDHMNDGTGIGLSLVKEFVKIHKGEISVKSKLDKGTEFKIDFILNAKQDAVETSNDETLNHLITNEVNLHEETTKEGKTITPEISNQPTVLIVEDDNDLRKYLVNELKDEFNILEAENGKIGLDLALYNVIDLIVSDISMPKMDGISMVEKIKEDERINHIPIILLTAYNSKPHMEKAYRAGVDEFIAKPFSSDLLLLRINSILESRKQLQSKFQKEFKVEGQDLPTTSMDQAFLNKAMEVIEDNLSNSSFSATDFAEEMCLSRVHLYRKLKSLTNESVSGFVKMVRLKLSADLIKDNKMSIKEVAYTVGFSDPKYFSKCFKQKYGVKPSEYVGQENNDLTI